LYNILALALIVKPIWAKARLSRGRVLYPDETGVQILLLAPHPVSENFVVCRDMASGFLMRP
jgi:hypothetical protein